MPSAAQRIIEGVACRDCGPRLSRALALVLRTIRNRSPRDLARIRRRVTGVVVGTLERGTVGEWVPQMDEANQLADNPMPNLPLDPRFHVRGLILLSAALESAPKADAVAIVAHELGHVATREREFDSRERTCDAEWASELCADMHAFRWGFGEQIRQQSPRRRIGHHAAIPGETLYIGKEERPHHVDHNFYLRPGKGRRE